MSYVRVDSSVRTNRKFLQAGPAASWLWLCGTAYCQETLTDGFIPFEAVKYLGVDHPKPLIAKLVKARLWDVVEGGWVVHDYLAHNNSAAHVAGVKAERRSAGQRGGEAPRRSKLLQQELQQEPEQPAKPATATATATATDPPQPPRGLSGVMTADDDVSRLAGEFLERYPGVYAKSRGGACYHVRPARDHPVAMGLVQQWPDSSYLANMLELFLRKTEWAPKNVPGSVGQFAHMAPQCDAELRRHGHAPRGSRRAS